VVVAVVAALSRHEKVPKLSVREKVQRYKLTFNLRIKLVNITSPQQRALLNHTYTHTPAHNRLWHFLGLSVSVLATQVLIDTVCRIFIMPFFLFYRDNIIDRQQELEAL